MLLGAPIGAADMARNLLPVIAGNPAGCLRWRNALPAQRPRVTR